MRVLKKISILTITTAVILAVFLLLSMLTPVGTAYAKEDNTVFLGGTPIGILAKSEGLVVSELVAVNTKSGSFSPALKAGVLKGDIILTADGVAVEDMFALNEIIANSKQPIALGIRRGSENLTIVVTPVFDLVQNALKIGLMVKNDLAGIGTLTFITKDYKFGALGHQITDAYGHGEIYQKGKIYSCDISGFIAGKEGQAGELQGNINLQNGALGVLNKNAFYGIYGDYDSNKLPDLVQIPIADRNEVKQGKAFIFTTINKRTPEMYEIEIVKVQKQDNPSEKGMVIKVVDNALKQKTGGILQGMSGSPIIQNGKLIGAVTHVFISDPTKGYAIFIDWMLQK